jgi:hypothetical protein
MPCAQPNRDTRRRRAARRRAAPRRFTLGHRGASRRARRQWKGIGRRRRLPRRRAASGRRAATYLYCAPPIACGCGAVTGCVPWRALARARAGGRYLVGPTGRKGGPLGLQRLLYNLLDLMQTPDLPSALIAISCKVRASAGPVPGQCACACRARAGPVPGQCQCQCRAAPVTVRIERWFPTRPDPTRPERRSSEAPAASVHARTE